MLTNKYTVDYYNSYHYLCQILMGAAKMSRDLNTESHWASKKRRRENASLKEYIHIRRIYRRHACMHVSCIMHSLPASTPEYTGRRRRSACCSLGSTPRWKSCNQTAAATLKRHAACMKVSCRFRTGFMHNGVRRLHTPVCIRYTSV